MLTATMGNEGYVSLMSESKLLRPVALLRQ